VKRKIWPAVWVTFCLTLCAVFVFGFGYMIHVSNLCIAADEKVRIIENDPNWLRYDWVVLYLTCCTPLGFALLLGRATL
jgi:hypothetical protein